MTTLHAPAKAPQASEPSRERFGLREFLSFLENRGQLLRIKKEVDAELEISEITDRVSKKEGPALLFEKIRGHSMPVLINLFGSFQRMSWAMGVSSLDQLA